MTATHTILFRFSIGLSGWILAASVLFADTEILEITTAMGRGADAHVTGADRGIEESDADRNFGKDAELGFKGSPNINYNSAIFLRFDLSKVAGREIKSARLQLHSTDGANFPLTGMTFRQNPPAHHQARFADVRIASDFQDLVSGKNLLVAAHFGEEGGNDEIGGRTDGIGFSEEPWKADQDFSAVTTSAPQRAGWTRNGRVLRVRGSVGREFADPIHMERGTVWLGGWIESTNASRTALLGIGGITLSHKRGESVALNGRGSGVPDSGGMNFFLVRLDFHPTGNRMWMWVNPDLASGREPAVDTAHVSFVGVSQTQRIETSVYGLKSIVHPGLRPGADGEEGFTQLGENWPENDITWRNAPGGWAHSLGDPVATGQVYHLYTQDLQHGRNGVEVNISSNKIKWFLNNNASGIPTLILRGHDDRALNLASKEHPLLPPPTLILEVEAN